MIKFAACLLLAIAPNISFAFECYKEGTITLTNSSRPPISFEFPGVVSSTSDSVNTDAFTMGPIAYAAPIGGFVSNSEVSGEFFWDKADNLVFPAGTSSAAFKISFLVNSNMGKRSGRKFHPSYQFILREKATGREVYREGWMQPLGVYDDHFIDLPMIKCGGFDQASSADLELEVFKDVVSRTKTYPHFLILREIHFFKIIVQ